MSQKEFGNLYSKWIKISTGFSIMGSIKEKEFENIQIT
jgi:hypothetical protein